MNRRPITIPFRVFHVRVDLVGLLPASSEGHAYLATIDRSIRWLEVNHGMMEVTKCKGTFLANWVACFGMPASVTTKERERNPHSCNATPIPALTTWAR